MKWNLLPPVAAILTAVLLAASIDGSPQSPLPTSRPARQRSAPIVSDFPNSSPSAMATSSSARSYSFS